MAPRPRFSALGRLGALASRRNGLRPLAALVAALLVLELAGCARRTPISWPPEQKYDPGTVGLAITKQGPDATFQRPGTIGAGPGAKHGARTGAVVPLVPGMVVTEYGGDARVVIFGLMLLGAGAILAPVGAGVGAAVGALTAPSKDAVDQNTAALERAFTGANLSDALTLWIIEAAGQRPIVPAVDPDSPAVDTLLELESLHVSLTSKDSTDMRPGLRLRMSIHGKLVRALDGEELGAWSWEQRGAKATFFEWGKDDARMLRAELERAGRALAAQVIRDLY